MWDFFIFTLIFLILAAWYRSEPFYWSQYGIPYTVPWPVFGSTVKTLYMPIREVWKDLYDKAGDGPVHGFHFFGKLALVVRDIEMIRKICVSQADSFMNRGLITNSHCDPLSKGLFFVNGEEWKQIRSKLTRFFTPSKIKDYMPVIVQTCDRLLDCIRKQSRESRLNVQEASMKFAVDVVMPIFFKVKPDSFDNPNSFFYHLQSELMSILFSIKLMIGELMPKLFKSLDITLFSKKSTQDLVTLMTDIINSKESNADDKQNFLDGIVQLMKDETLSDDDKKFNSDGTPISRFTTFSVVGQCMMMYLAGTETTGNTLAFLLFELAVNQHIQDKVRLEINKMKERTQGNYKLEDLNNLKYLNMVINESLRKYPIVSVITRKCSKTVTVDGIKIPKGSFIIFPAFTIQRDARYYPDPDSFKPERFENSTLTEAVPYMPFGMGSRYCIGMKLAMTEICYALCKLLPEVKFEICEKTPIPMKFNSSPTLGPASGVWLKAKIIS